MELAVFFAAHFDGEPDPPHRKCSGHRGTWPNPRTRECPSVRRSEFHRSSPESPAHPSLTLRSGPQLSCGEDPVPSGDALVLRDGAAQLLSMRAMGVRRRADCSASSTLSPHPEERPQGASRRRIQASLETPSCFETGLAALLSMRAMGARRRHTRRHCPAVTGRVHRTYGSRRHSRAASPRRSRSASETGPAVTRPRAPAARTRSTTQRQVVRQTAAFPLWRVQSAAHCATGFGPTTEARPDRAPNRTTWWTR